MCINHLKEIMAVALSEADVILALSLKQQLRIWVPTEVLANLNHSPTTHI